MAAETRIRDWTGKAGNGVRDWGRIKAFHADEAKDVYMKFLDTFASGSDLNYKTPISSLSSPPVPEKSKRFPLCSSLRKSLYDVIDQTWLLLWKTYLVFSRHQISVWAQVLTPFLLCFFIFCVQLMIQALLRKYIDFDPASESINMLPRCRGKDCITVGVGYTDGTTPWTTHVVRHIANHQNLTLGKEIVELGTTYQDTLEFLKMHPNITQAAVIFCTGTINMQNNQELPMLKCAGNSTNDLMLYSIVYNFTAVNLPIFIKPDERSPINRAILPLKLAVDNGLLDYHRKRKGLAPVSIEGEVSDFPHLPNRMAAGYDTVTLQGPLYFFLPPMIIFIMIMSEMVREKEQQLRKTLNVLGVSQVAFWWSWILTGLGFSLVVSNIMVLAGRVMDFDFFTKSPYLYFLDRVVFLLFFTFTNTMLAFGFFLVTLLDSGKTTYTVRFTQVTYSLLLVGLVLQGFISSHLIIICIFVTDLSPWFTFCRTVLQLYPPFNFATAFYDISRRSSWHPLVTERRWAPGEGYGWEHFFQRQEGVFKHHNYTTPSLFDSLNALVLNLVLFAVLTWVCDHVVASNRGVGAPIWFPFTKKYWGIRRTQDRVRQDIEMRALPRESADEEIEHVKFLEREGTAAEGIRVINLGKTYQKHLLFTSENDVQALHGLYLTAEKDEVLTLLGHNGAGKSTLLSLLSGTASPSSGTATVCGYDITDSMDDIRRKMGFCPQHSLLWDELTAEEHIYLFSRLKGASPMQARKDTEAVLKEVELSQVANARVGTFSGGMRRRISIALAGTGNPEVILMDEPTTGLDPISRVHIWKLIQSMKRNRVLILTTHSMEEADALSDRIAVLVDGALKCIGTSLYLKNRFGSGYRVSLISSDREKVCEVIRQHVPRAVLLDTSADSLIVSLPKDDFHTMTAFFSLIESGLLASLVSDWGISNTTLEQVFMEVTGKKPLIS